MKTLIGLLATLLLTGLLWYGIHTTYPMYIATEAIAKAREIGALTPELAAEVRHEDFKSSLVVYVLWGVTLGLIGLLAGGWAKWPIRLMVGILLGAAAGVLVNYGSDWYSVTSEPPRDVMQYWLIRQCLLLPPMTLVVALVATLAHWSLDRLVENVVKVVIATFLAAFAFTFAMGWLTPLEQAQYYFPQFESNQISLLFAVDVLVYLAIVVRGRKREEAAVDVSAVEPPDRSPAEEPRPTGGPTPTDLSR